MIHPSAIVAPGAKLGANVSVGPFSIIHDNVEIGAGSVIDAYCEIGYPTPLADGLPLRIGAGARIRSHSVFYQGSTFGARLVTGHRVTVREKTTAGVAFQIGTMNEIQGDCTIGDHVRCQSNVFIGKMTTIGDFVWLFPYVVLTNDPHPPSNLLLGCQIGDYAAIAAMSVVLPGVKVGRHALVAAASKVHRDVAPATVVGGNPARYLCDTSTIRLRDGSEQPAYPWTTHFRRGYPAEVTAGWDAPADLSEQDTPP
ncbi:N-acetyltransferase [Rugamonas sp. CCM 8940]|uniref:N-acetyltransferase n=1 Tax=Rugamonas sp. CCM 8940 TaxID=2765359 RepID=UPI0018F6E740|nr:N-acetyltransferase [Rugamonas sp. CCM 8940]MBJ7309757.1 N-acetyltransferase [Rugamonas sp. CCM 8940]